MIFKTLKTTLHPGPWFMISASLGEYFSAAFCGAASVIWLFD